MRRFPARTMSLFIASLLTSTGCAINSQSSSIVTSPFATDSIAGVEYYQRESFGPLPTLSQSAIDEAVKRFAIKTPKHVARPQLDHELIDRGRTSWNLFGGSVSVKLGPTAFSSWGLLGATLAHELEIHCQQNLFAIGFKDALGLDAKNIAEKEAYTHELANADRFGLSPEETQKIKDTLEAIIGPG